jgi:hypothetical protein
LNFAVDGNQGCNHFLYKTLWYPNTEKMGDSTEAATFDAANALKDWGLATACVKADGGAQGFLSRLFFFFFTFHINCLLFYFSLFSFPPHSHFHHNNTYYIGASNLSAALNVCGDDSIDVDQRLSIVSAIKIWCSLTDNSVRLKPLIENIPTLCSLITNITLQPDDDPAKKAEEEAAAEAKQFEEEAAAAIAAGKKPKKVKPKREKKVDYGKCGLQEIACDLAKMMNSFSSTSPEFATAAWGGVLDVLEKISKVDYVKKTPLKRDGPAISRYETIHNLLRTGPSFTHQQQGGASVPPNILTVAQLYMGNSDLSVNAAQLVNAAERCEAGFFTDKMDTLFDIIRKNNKVEVFAALNTTATKNYETVRPHFEKNIDVLFTLDFTRTCTIFNTMANNGSGKALSAYTDKFVEMLELKTVKHDVMVFYILGSISASNPDAVFPYVDKLYQFALSTPNAGNTLASLLANCGKTSIDNMKKKDSTMKITEMLCRMLSEDSFGEQVVPSVLNGIVNQFSLLGEENTSVLTTHMDKIKSYSGKSGIIVEKIVDWYEGRSLKKTDERLDALETKVAAMNEDFAATCHNMEEVSALMDKKIGDLKEFVGEIVKKLPQPCQLEVVGGMRKTLILHFRCARSGQTVTTETKDWDQWCKVGFGLIKLGKCAAVAAAGNPMALAGGVGAIQDIYNGYKTKDDKDFNTFISQPFLTSAESDKLINQLRAGKFFEKMEYDAQTADWVCIGMLSQEELEKRSDKKESIQETRSNVTKTKGKNFGLGTLDSGAISGLTTLAGDSAFIATNSGNEDAAALAATMSATVSENIELASNAMGAAALVKQVANDSKVVKKAPLPVPVESPMSPLMPLPSPPATAATDSSSSSASANPSSPPTVTSPRSPPIIIKKEKKRGSIFGGLFGGNSSSTSSSNAAEEAMAKAAEEAWVIRAAQDSAKIKELEERVVFLEKEQSRVNVLEEQVKKLMAAQGLN